MGKNTKKYNRNYYLNHKNKINNTSKKWFKANKKQSLLSSRKSHLKNAYGITPEEYAWMLQDQLGLCAICGKPETATTKLGKIKRLSIDHNHKTGKMRKLLCVSCNATLGLVGDNQDTLLKMVIYLRNN